MFGKYAGTVEDIHKGTVFVRLELGVNAIAHSCYDNRTVGKKDVVSFVVTHIDEDRNVAVGIITRITNKISNYKRNKKEYRSFHLFLRYEILHVILSEYN